MLFLDHLVEINVEAWLEPLITDSKMPYISRHGLIVVSLEIHTLLHNVFLEAGKID
jgi:hypothetical protein